MDLLPRVSFFSMSIPWRYATYILGLWIATATVALMTSGVALATPTKPSERSSGACGLLRVLHRDTLDSKEQIDPQYSVYNRSLVHQVVTADQKVADRLPVFSGPRALRWVCVSGTKITRSGSMPGLIKAHSIKEKRQAPLSFVKKTIHVKKVLQRAPQLAASLGTAGRRNPALSARMLVHADAVLVSAAGAPTKRSFVLARITLQGNRVAPPQLPNWKKFVDDFHAILDRSTDQFKGEEWSYREVDVTIAPPSAADGPPCGIRDKIGAPASIGTIFSAVKQKTSIGADETTLLIYPIGVGDPRACAGSIPSDVAFFDRSAFEGTTPAHELGHVFGLAHVSTYRTSWVPFKRVSFEKLEEYASGYLMGFANFLPNNLNPTEVERLRMVRQKTQLDYPYLWLFDDAVETRHGIAQVRLQSPRVAPLTPVWDNKRPYDISQVVYLGMALGGYRSKAEAYVTLDNVVAGAALFEVSLMRGIYVQAGRYSLSVRESYELPNKLGKITVTEIKDGVVTVDFESAGDLDNDGEFNTLETVDRKWTEIRPVIQGKERSFLKVVCPIGGGQDSSPYGTIFPDPCTKRGQISGHVRDQDGKPQVVAIQAWDSVHQESGGMGTSDQNGFYSIGFLRPSTYRLIVPRVLDPHPPVTLAEGQSLEVDLTFNLPTPFPTRTATPVATLPPTIAPPTIPPPPTVIVPTATRTPIPTPVAPTATPTNTPTPTATHPESFLAVSVRGTQSQLAVAEPFIELKFLDTSNPNKVHIIKRGSGSGQGDFDNIPRGRYELRIAAPGYAPYLESLTLNSSAGQYREITLHEGPYSVVHGKVTAEDKALFAATTVDLTSNGIDPLSDTLSAAGLFFFGVPGDNTSFSVHIIPPADFSSVPDSHSGTVSGSATLYGPIQFSLEQGAGLTPTPSDTIAITPTASVTVPPIVTATAPPPTQTIGPVPTVPIAGTPTPFPTPAATPVADGLYFDGSINTLTFSPDGTRLIVGGSFKEVAGLQREYLAAVDPMTGEIDGSWNAQRTYKNIDWPLNGAVRSVVAVGNTLFVGGAFTGNIAAFDIASGKGALPYFVSPAITRLSHLETDGATVYAFGNKIAAFSAETGNALQGFVPGIPRGDNTTFVHADLFGSTIAVVVKDESMLSYKVVLMDKRTGAQRSWTLQDTFEPRSGSDSYFISGVELTEHLVIVAGDFHSDQGGENLVAYDRKTGKFVATMSHIAPIDRLLDIESGRVFLAQDLPSSSTAFMELFVNSWSLGSALTPTLQPGDTPWTGNVLNVSPDGALVALGGKPSRSLPQTRSGSVAVLYLSQEMVTVTPVPILSML